MRRERAQQDDSHIQDQILDTKDELTHRNQLVISRHN